MANDTGHARNPRPLNRGDGDALLLGEPAGAEGGRTGSAASREERACEAERLGTNRPFRVRAEQCEGSQLQRSTCNSAAKPRRPNSGGRTLEAVAEQFVPSKKPYFSRLEPLSGVDERKVIDTFQSLVAVQIVPATTPARQRRCSSLFPNQQPARDGSVCRRDMGIAIIQCVGIHDDAVEPPVLVYHDKALAIRRYGPDHLLRHFGRR
jgi:hypothetical protein